MSGCSIGRLQLALAAAGGEYRRGSAPTVGQLLEPLGPQSAALSAALLALPFLSPVSLGPVTTVASVVLMLLGLQLVRRREGAALPARLLSTPVPQPFHRVADAVVTQLARLLARLSRPRHSLLVRGRHGRWLCGAGVLAGALLLAVPIPLLPLTNTFPALGIVCFALGWSEQDGLLTLVGGASLLLSAVLFAALGGAVALLGVEAVQALSRFAPDTL